MKKTKIITILIALGIVTAMTGIAAATPAEVDILPDGFSLSAGQYVTTTAHMYEMDCDGSQRTLDVSVKKGTANDLTFKILDPNTLATLGPTVGGITYLYTPAVGTTSYDIQVDIKAAAGTEGNSYTLYYEDVQSGEWDTASATVHTSSIPEFVTIAIPTVAILGMFLFLNHRKHKKE